MSRLGTTIDVSHAITAGAPFAAWTPASGKRFVLLGFELSCSAAAAVIFQDGDTVKHRTAKVAIDTPTRSIVDYELVGTVGNALKLDVSASATVTGYLYGFEY